MGSLRASRPWELVAMDMIGPLPVTTSGERFVLVAICHFTKFVVAEAVPSASAAEAARFWAHRVVAAHGSPARLLTDQGSNFMAELFQDLCKHLGVKRARTTAYHPQGDGMAERVIGTLMRFLRRTLVGEDGAEDTWAELLPWAVLAYNSATHSQTGESPYFLMHGREPTLPVSRAVIAGTSEDLDEEEWTPGSILVSVRRAFGRAAATLAARDAQRQGKAAEKRRDMRMPVGSRVWLFTPRGRSAGKLAPRWVGPLRVLRVVSDQVRELEAEAGKKPVVVNVGRLKPYVDWDGPPEEILEVGPLDSGEFARDKELVTAADGTAAALLRSLAEDAT